MCRTRHFIGVIVLFAAVVACLAGCNPAHVGWPERCARRAIALYDTDGDGRIDGPELNKCPGLKSAIARLDPIGRREITADAIVARIQSWQASRLGRVGVRCLVTHNGQPLEDAEVRFVPEKFFDVVVERDYRQFTTATGKTDANGVASMSVPVAKSAGPPGVSPGFYRVEITKPGEMIPAKYNTDTTLGFEVAIDVEEMRTGLKFDLRY